VVDREPCHGRRSRHTWPSALTPPPDGYGTVSLDLDASAEAVAFVLDPAGFG
jgi:hypothetical protein